MACNPIRRRRRRTWPGVLKALLLLLPFAPANALGDEPKPSDTYEKYVQGSKDFRRVKQDKAWCHAAFPSWTYMPWTHQWTIGYTAASAAWAVAHGYNGAFVDGNVAGLDEPNRSKLGWIDRSGLRFYLDHAATKHFLHLWDGDAVRQHLDELHGAGVRPVPVNDALGRTLRDKIRRNLDAVKASPNRAAYALDDEISWGHFVHPAMWRITDDPGAYRSWLQEIYGRDAPKRDSWVTYENVRPKLAGWSVGQFDASPLLDQWTFNDSYWNNFLGDLVEYANEVDPRTPCGFVGGQAPNAFGGYDYAKLMRKVQFLESYNVGSSQAIIRSFNPGNAIPAVTTHFHRSTEDDIWQTWYYLAHGNRGFIGWVEGWFDGGRPEPWHDQVAPHYREAAEKIGPLLAGAEWVDDGVAVYYSHASIQLGWVLDAAAHGKTWTQRNSDERLGSAHLVRHAWENMLRDSGLQYDFLSYADVVQGGVPSKYKVLILPGCLCLSDAEARRIEAFRRAGGTVVADYMPGLWDQHGKGRPGGGALDAMFGVRHDPGLRAGDLFNGGDLWCEVDQDANYSWKTYREFITNHNSCLRGAGGYHKAVRSMTGGEVRRQGEGTAVLLNLSPQWYNAYREAGHEEARRREVFLRPVLERCQPWARLKDAGEAEHGYEITYWRKDGRTIVCLCLNPEVAGSHLGGGNATGLKTRTMAVTLAFGDAVAGLRDERTGRELGAGREFRLDWTMNEAVVVSFPGPPPRGR